MQVGLARETKDAEVLLSAAKIIQEQINDVLRPLSHRLWINGLGQLKHRNFLSILKTAIENLNFDVKFILAYQFFIGGYGISLVIGVQSSLFMTSVAVVTSILLITIFLRIQSENEKFRFQIGLTFLVLEGLLPVLIPLLIPTQLNDYASFYAGLIISPTIPGLILLISAYRLIIEDRELAIGAASSVGYRVANLVAESDSVQNQFELAEYFHNSLQS
jgi:hypothetical protein